MEAQRYRLIGGIDPGLASGGFVVVDRADKERVLEAYSLGAPRGAQKESTAEAKSLGEIVGGYTDTEFSAATLRAEQWVDRFAEALDRSEVEHGEVDAFAIETYVDQPSRAAKGPVRKGWQTPLVIGHLIPFLRERGVSMSKRRIFFQNAGVVIRQWQKEDASLKGRPAGRDVLVPGDSLVTNDHQRKALFHALALSMRLPALRKEQDARD